MTFVYLICFLLLAVGAVLLLKLTPERITGDLMRFVSPKQTLRDKVLTRKGKKKSRKITVELRRIKDALEQTGKGNQFAVACAASLLLMIVGCVIAIMIDNPFLVPVFAIAFAMIPFIYAKRTVAYYDNHVKEELETALSIITTSYVRTDDIVSAVKENIQYLKPPVKDIFAGFVAENMMISSDVKQSIRHLKEKVNNSIFAEWCETLVTVVYGLSKSTRQAQRIRQSCHASGIRKRSRFICIHALWMDLNSEKSFRMRVEKTKCSQAPMTLKMRSLAKETLIIERKEAENDKRIAILFKELACLFELESAAMPKLRTIKGALKEIKATDPESVMTDYKIRWLIKSGRLRSYAVGTREIIVMESFDDENLLTQESREGCNITQGIKLSEQYGELLSKTTQSYTCTRRR